MEAAKHEVGRGTGEIRGTDDEAFRADLAVRTELPGDGFAGALGRHFVGPGSGISGAKTLGSDARRIKARQAKSGTAQARTVGRQINHEVFCARGQTTDVQQDCSLRRTHVRPYPQVPIY
jgi:hypothetical protein